ncbi:zinc finger protein 557-like isoform X1 [Notolabrus celidotus]|uniref:zinc finger protein 557-like isoform X1 n=1 Tax=Notolabrus celidotus TaxID=1203425 RepID=UPI00148FCFD1|nr:zinc finger protein 557-like isoform X1 [Notolabrus celidotus]
MANATLQSFNVFLTDRLTAAAVDIYGFVEKTIIDYQDEVYRTKLENQRLQRLLDLVYKPEIRLHRADARQIDLTAPTQEVCPQEQQIQRECVPSEEPDILPLKEEQTEPWARCEETPVCPPYCSITDSLTHMVKVGEETQDDPARSLIVGRQSEYRDLDGLARVVTVGEHFNYEMPDEEQPLPSFQVSSPYPRKKDVFFCNICCKPFENKMELKWHLATHSTKLSPKFRSKTFTCSLCAKTTHSRSHMMIHMRSHTSEKPHACPICGNRYKMKSHIKEHIRTHTGERPYTCYICGQSFNRSSTMSKHTRNKHMENNAFKCMQCSQCFPLLVLLKRHLRTVHDVIYPV